MKELKQAIERDGRSLNALARDAGIAPILLSRFVRGIRGLNTATVDALCEVLGLQLTPKRRQKER